MKILVIPDCQIKDGVPTDHLTWAGNAIVDYRPDVVVNLGDFADMPSLSTHDIKGSKYFEGLRYKNDIEVAKTAMQKLLNPVKDLQLKQKKNKEKVYKPRIFTLFSSMVSVSTIIGLLELWVGPLVLLPLLLVSSTCLAWLVINKESK